MKKIFAMLAFLIGFNAQAGLITVELSSDEIDSADSVSVILKASDFDETDGFFFDFTFDNSILGYEASSLTSDLFIFDNQSPFYGLAVTEMASGLGFDFLTDMFTPVEGDFTLASFTLTGLSAGTSLIGLVDFFSYGAFSDYDVEYTTFSSVTVNSTSVPEPSSVILMLLAGVALVNGRRKA